MRTTIFIILTIITMNSCRYEYKACECNVTDNQAKMYSDILNELVEHHFYNRYLGNDEEEIFNEYIAETPDSLKIKRKLIRLQNNLFNDTSRFCNIYLDSIYRPYFNQWSYYQKDTAQFAKETVHLISAFSTDGQSVIDSLNSMQSNIKPSGFQLCTSKVLSIRDLKSQKGKCAIGIVSLSKVFLDKTGIKGLLYCNFRCAGICGKGELLVVEKINNRWTITRTICSWIS